MSVRLPRTLYIRVDRSLRADLAVAAEAAGQTLSAFVRDALCGVIARPDRGGTGVEPAKESTRPGDEGSVAFHERITQPRGEAA